MKKLKKSLKTIVSERFSYFVVNVMSCPLNFGQTARRIKPMVKTILANSVAKD